MLNHVRRSKNFLRLWCMGVYVLAMEYYFQERAHSTYDRLLSVPASVATYAYTVAIQHSAEYIRTLVPSHWFIDP